MREFFVATSAAESLSLESARVCVLYFVAFFFLSISFLVLNSKRKREKEGIQNRKWRWSRVRVDREVKVNDESFFQPSNSNLTFFSFPFLSLISIAPLPISPFLKPIKRLAVSDVLQTRIVIT